MTTEKGIVYGGTDIVDPLEGTRSLGAYCQKRLNEIGEVVVLIDGLTGETVTARQLCNRSARVAEIFRDLGVGAGSTVGLCTENRLEFAYVLFGSFMVGATVAAFNPTYTNDELEQTFHLSKPNIIFTSPISVIAILTIVKKYRNRHVVVFDGKDSSPIIGAQPYVQFLRGIISTENHFECPPQDVNQHVGLILYSSGTTGFPKGVQLTQSNTALAIQRHFARDNPDEKELGFQILVNVAPFFHTFGVHVLLMTILYGYQVVTLPNFDPHTFLGVIQKYKANTTSIAPPLMVFLAKSPLVDQYDISTMRLIFVGSAPLSGELKQAVFGRLNDPIIRNGYGMTEGTLGFTCQNYRYEKSGSVGGIVAGIQGRVVDPQSGRVLDANEEGELQFKGATMKGYVDDEKATREAITDDGWLRTGDIGYFDADGELFIVDRLKELIKVKGFQVAPAELEALLLKNKKIADVGVIGIPDERAGEVPLAFVVRQSNVELSEAEVIEYVAKNTSSSKHLQGGVRFVEIIPKNQSGKILRRELRALFKALKSKL